MIKMKCQWFQLTAGNHREDPHQTGRLPAAGFRHSKCAAAAHPLQVIHEHDSGRTKLIVLTISTAVWWRCHSSSASTRSADSVAGIRSFPVMRRINVGHQRKKIVKKHPVDPQPLEHGVIAPRELNDGQAPFSVSHHRMVHPNSVVDCFGCSTGTTRGDTGSAASDWPWALTKKWRFIACWSVLSKREARFLQTGCHLLWFASFGWKRYYLPN